MAGRPRKIQNPQVNTTSDSPTERATAPDTVTEVSTPLQEARQGSESQPQVQVIEKIVERVVYRDAPTPPLPSIPRQMRVERQNDQGVPMARRFPDIRGGICEFCGVIDRNQPSHFQYKLCNHYRGMQIRCTYCKPERDSDDVNAHATVVAFEDPFNPGTIIFCCSLSECMDKHQKRFNRTS